VVFALVPNSFAFLSVQASTFSNGQFIIKDKIPVKETTYAVTLRAYVDGKAAEANLSVIVTSKPEQTTESVAKEPPAEEE
jgi:hypothetical protein